MAKRTIVFGSYDTAATGLWLLTGWEFSPAEYKSEFVEVPGRDGDLDLSTSLTDGVPKYGNRVLTATFESSEGTRLEREARINTMINWLDGWKMNITLPDDDAHYITGRIHVAREYNDMVHCAVAVEAVCEPWRYNVNETIHVLTAAETTQTAMLSNAGRRTVVPLLSITGEEAAVELSFGGANWALSAGTYQLPDMVLNQGGAPLTYKGTGTITLSYREAVL